MAINNTVVGDEEDLYDEELDEDMDDQEFVEQEEEMNLVTSMESRLNKLIAMPRRLQGLEELSMDYDAVLRAQEDQDRAQQLREVLEAAANVAMPDVGEAVVTHLDLGTGMEAMNGFKETVKQRLKELYEWLKRVFAHLREFLFNRIKRARKRLNYVKLLMKTNRIGGASGVVKYPVSITRLVKSTNYSKNPSWVLANLNEGYEFFKGIKSGYAGMKTQLSAVAKATTREEMLSLVATTTEQFRKLAKAETQVAGTYRSGLMPGNKMVVVSTGKGFDDYDFLITTSAVKIPDLSKEVIVPERATIDSVVGLCDEILKDIEKDFQNTESLTQEFKKAIDAQTGALEEHSRNNLMTTACFAWYAHMQKRTLNSSLQYLLRLVDSGLDFAAAALR